MSYAGDFTPRINDLLNCSIMAFMLSVRYECDDA